LGPNDLKQEAKRVLQEMPEEFRSRIENVEIVIEKRPKNSQLKALGLDPRQETLYGLYEGTPLPERSVLDLPLLPDKITLYSEPLLRDFPEPADLREQIRQTVIHEIAHYFGMSDEEIEDLGY
jgi:predicted Zn-dependent protease with MMP-like domain